MFFGGDPFEHFGGGGGPRGGPRGEVDNEEFYKILGVAKDASDTDIKKVRGSRSALRYFSARFCGAHVVFCYRYRLHYM
jgi:hypothetical protein